MKKLMLAFAAVGGLLAFAEDIPWVYENNHPADRTTAVSSEVTLSEAGSSDLQSSALDFFCSYWCETFDAGPFTILSPRRGVVIIMR